MLNKQRPGHQWAVLLDTKGPEIRTGELENHKPITLEAGQQLQIVTDYTIEGDNTRIAWSYKDLPYTVKPGDQILIADGTLVWTVKECYEDSVTVEVMNNCTIGEKKNMNLPGIEVNLPTLTEQDEIDIVDFGVKRGVDFIAASFIRKASDIEYIREVLGVKGAHIKIISKIENQEGLQNFEEILQESDGIMVARGDLGMEIPTEKVFLAQKWMIELSNAYSKPVIVATQMLESMINNPRPTRAEAGDVANAILDGADWVMLSGETAGGKFPVAAVQIMASTIWEAEKMLDYKALYYSIVKSSPSPYRTSELMAAAIASAALTIKIDLIIVTTITGRMARLVSKYRPKQFILACSTSQSVVRQTNLMRGVIGYRIPSFHGVGDLLKIIIKSAKSMGLCKSGHRCITLHAKKEEGQDHSNIMKIVDIE